MGFWERYVAACNRKGIRPQTQRNADAFGVTRASITSWKSKNIVPNGSVIAKIADYLGVTTDYLLGRSDDIESGAPKIDTPVPQGADALLLTERRGQDPRGGVHGGAADV